MMKKKEEEWEQKKQAAHIRSTDTVVDLCYRHLRYQIENGSLKDKSIDRRECTIENQIRPYPIGEMQIQAVSSIEVEALVNSLIAEDKVAGSSIVKAVDVLNAAFEWAVKRKDLEENPVYAIKPELKKKISRLSYKGANDADVEALSDDEATLLEKEACKVCHNGKRKYIAGDYCLLLLYTGMRVGEMIALRWKDWDGKILVIEKSISMAKNRDKKEGIDSNFISVEGTTKNQKARIIQLSDDANAVLQRIKKSRKHCDPDELVVPTRSGSVNTASNMGNRLRTILKNAGFTDPKYGVHILRKTFATRMFEAGARVEEIAAYIGDLPSTTRKYYIAIRKKVISDGEVRQIVELPTMKRRVNVERVE